MKSEFVNLVSKYQNSKSELEISLHSLSFRFACNHSELTIFNFFNFIAHEFSAGWNLLEIFRVFEGLAKDCISTFCKHIENRLKKDGVLMVRKRRVSSAKTKSFESKDFVFLRKDGVFFQWNLILSFRRRYFGRKSPKNRRKIPQTYLFCFLTSLFGK